MSNMKPCKRQLDEKIEAKQMALGHAHLVAAQVPLLSRELDALLAEKAALPTAADWGWFVNTGDGRPVQASYPPYGYIAMGMVAPTREAAERKAKRIAVLNKLWDLAEASGPIGEGWYEPRYDYQLKRWISITCIYMTSGLGRFATKESCDAAMAACDMSALVHEGAR